MEHFPAHILLCGSRRSGRSSMIRALLQSSALPAYGFMTRSMNTRADGYHEIYMFSAGQTDGRCGPENHVGDCNTKERTVNLRVFETLGLKLLEAKPDGIVAMDELGFMEAKAPAFCARVLELLDGEIPVLATVKAGRRDVDFLNRVCSHPKAECYELRSDNAEELYRMLSPIVESWNMKLGC